MKPEIGDKVSIKNFNTTYEGIVYRLPTEDSEFYYVGTEAGNSIYANDNQIQVLFRPKYHYVNRCPFKVGDLVNWYGTRCLVVGFFEGGESNYRLMEVPGGVDPFDVREQDLMLIHAAEHPEVEQAVAPIKPLDQPAPLGWEDVTEEPAEYWEKEEADDDYLY